MAGVQGISNVHRQATFDTNRLKLQIGSLDLPVIDSGEESKPSIHSPRGDRVDVKHETLNDQKALNKNNSRETKINTSPSDQKSSNKTESKETKINATAGDHKSLNKSEPRETIVNGQTSKAQGNKSSSISQSVVTAKHENKGSESKAKPQSTATQEAHKTDSQSHNTSKQDNTKKGDPKEKNHTKAQQPNQSPPTVQKTHKGGGVSQRGEVTGTTQSKVGQTSKSSPVEQKSNDIRGDKSNLIVDSKKGHKKESVLSKLNASKSAKPDSSNKQEEPVSTTKGQHLKSQNKTDDVTNNDTKIKTTTIPKVSHSSTDSGKLSPKRAKKENKQQKLDTNNENTHTLKDAANKKKHNVLFNINEARVNETKPQNVPSIDIKTENRSRADNKLTSDVKQNNKTSQLKTDNTRSDQSPARQPISLQGGKASEQGTVNLSPKDEKKSKTINRTKQSKPETVSPDIVSQSVDKEKNNKEGTYLAKGSTIQGRDVRDTQSNNISKGNTYDRPPTPVKVNDISAQSNPKDIVNSPRSVESNDSRGGSDTGVNEIPVNKAPVGTNLKVQDHPNRVSNQGRNVKANHSKYREDETLPDLPESDTVTQNPLVESIAIEQRESKMDGKRRETYEGLHAERNTLLKAEKAYKARIKQLEDEANGFLKVIEDLTSENRSLRKKIDMLESELNADGKTNSVEQIENLEEENRALKTLMKGQKEVITELKQSRGSVDQETESRELRLEIVKLQSENQTQNEENVKLKADYYGTVKKLNNLIAESKSERSTTDVASDDKTKRLVKTLQTESAEQKKQINTLEYENKTLSECLAQKKTELQEILGVMKDENKFDNELKDLKNEVIKLKKERRELELEHVKEKRDLHAHLEEKSSLLSEKSLQFDELKIKSDEMESEKSKMKDLNETLSTNNDSLQKELDRLKSEVKRLELELQESKDLYSNLLSQTEIASNDLKATKGELETFNKDLQSIVADKEGQISKLISQLDTLRHDKELDKKTFDEEKKALSSEIERLKVFETHYLQKEKELQSCQGKLEESDLKKRQLSINLEDKGFEVSNLQQQVFELNMKLDGHAKRMSQLDKDKRELEIDKRDWEIKKDKVNDIESSNKRLLEENKRLRNQLELTTAMDYKVVPETTPEAIKSPAEAWVLEKANQQALYVKRERNRKKVHIVAEHSVSKKRQPYTKSSPVRSTKPQTKREVLKVGLNSSRSLEDIRRTPERRGTPDSQPSLPEVNKDPRLTVGGSIYGGYSEIHRNRIRAAHKRVY